MIRLIATDIDGTLVKSAGAPLPEGIFDLIRFFKSKGILFVAASGRQYSNLRSIFEEVADDMAFLAENGTLVMYKGEVLYSAAMDSEKAIQLANETQAMDGIEVLISTPEHFITNIKTEQYRQELESLAGMKNVEVDSFEGITEDIIKVALYNPNGMPDEVCEKLYEKWNSTFECVRSQATWYDFMKKNANKGTGMKALLEKTGIDPEDAYAFGDNYNDKEMLQLVGHGYIMSFSPEALKKTIRYETDDVMKVLRELAASL